MFAVGLLSMGLTIFIAVKGDEKATVVVSVAWMFRASRGCFGFTLRAHLYASIPVYCVALCFGIRIGIIGMHF